MEVFKKKAGVIKLSPQIWGEGFSFLRYEVSTDETSATLVTAYKLHGVTTHISAYFS
jgi:hypothetical protein